jgi:predicted nuclease of predicted toxin-antitoxin system
MKTLRAKLDESMPNEAADVLRTAGWECETVHDEGLSGADDTRVAEVCQSEDRVLFTLDLDFADIRTYPPADYVGIVVLRPEQLSRDTVLALLRRALPVLTSSWIPHHLWIVEASRIRMRTATRMAT